MRLEEVTVGQASDLVGKSLRDLGIGKHTGAISVWIHGKDGRARVDRTPDTPLSTVVIEEGDVLIALGSDAHLGTLQVYAEGT
jgi:K+/H+ antiporter YhaU regulatory subunit KhtT